MTGNIQEELTQVIGLARNLYSAAQETANRSNLQLSNINALVKKLDGVESRIATTVRAEVASQFSQAATAAAETIVQRQEKVNTGAKEAIKAYDAAVRHSAKRILLTCFGLGTIGIVAMAAFAYFTVWHWSDWLGYPPTVVPVVACQDSVKSWQCVRVSVTSGQPACVMGRDGTALCVPAKN